MNAAGRKVTAHVPGEKRITRAKAVNGNRAMGSTRIGLSDNVNMKRTNGQVLKTKLEAKALGEKEKAVEHFEGGDDKAAEAPSRDDIVLNCSEYGSDMADYMFWLQKKFPVAEDFLNDREVTSKMRSILMDWLVEVHFRFHLLPETFFGTVSIVDRYLSVGSADKNNLQLVGVACMCISAKYEEIYPPDLQDYEFISENSFSKKDIIRLELKVLSSLKCELGRPSVILFIRRLSIYFNQWVHSIAKYIGENAACDYSTCHLLPSKIAAVAVWIAALLQKTPFAAAIYDVARISREEMHQLAPLVARGLIATQTSTKLTALRTKYAHAKNGHASEMTSGQMEILRNIASDDAKLLSKMP